MTKMKNRHLVLGLPLLLLWLLWLVPVSAAADWGVEDCSACHGQVSLAGSIHEDLECADCHQAVLDAGVEHIADPVDTARICLGCAACHDEEVDDHLHHSVHGRLVKINGRETQAASCYSCHGGHRILPVDNADSPVYPTRVAGTCGRCHGDEELLKSLDIPNLHPVAHYQRSVHAQALAKGNLEAATCNDCHGDHTVRSMAEANSPVNHRNVPQTCGQCHPRELQDYQGSVHWKALQRGQREAPACNDCHGEHEVVSPGETATKKQLAQKTCIRCHADQVLEEKYGFDEETVISYMDSYHGLAVKRGDPDAAACYDCHGTHAIRTEEDTLSTVNPANLVNTCGKCHEGATTAFTSTYSHRSVVVREHPIQYYIRIIYYFLIAGTIGFMLLHNLLHLSYFIRRKFQHEYAEDYIQRFSGTMAVQHFLLALSFTVLVITGFALRFPDAAWVRLLIWLGMNENVRSIIHRASGIVMIIASVWHLLEVLFTPRGREFLMDMLPVLGDVGKFTGNVRFHLTGKGPEPRFERFGYIEKMEYWALIWGTLVMVVTGLILFFPTLLGDATPAWFIKVAETIHYYEAWLATLAIIVWHFYFVIFNPAEYPVSTVWRHGRMSLEELREKHPAMHQRLRDELLQYSAGNIKEQDLSYHAYEYVKRHGKEGKEKLQERINNF